LPLPLPEKSAIVFITIKSVVWRGIEMIATSTHRVTMPKKVSAFLTKKAKAQNTSFSQVILDMIQDAIEYAEEGHIWEEALMREKTCTGDFVPNDEFWKLANEIPYNP